MFEYFNENGELKITVEAAFDSEGDLRYEIYNQAKERLNDFPSDSDAVKLFYAEEMACQTHGNYSADTLFYRAFR